MTNQSFGEQRTQRYRKALQRCLYARLNELIPAVFLLAQEGKRSHTLLDLACGTGYLTDVIGPFFERVIKVDRSPSMLRASQSDADCIYADLRDVRRAVFPTLQVDAITCLAGLHHACKLAHGVVNAADSEACQARTIENWTRLLAPGGKLLLIDVGVPDLPVQREKGQEGASKALQHYYDLRHSFFQQKDFAVGSALTAALGSIAPEYHLEARLQQLGAFSSARPISLATIVEQQHLRFQALPEKLLTVAFFDEIVARFSIDGHVAHFPREKSTRAALENSGLENIFVSCLPTPWILGSEREAVWFVRELFGLGEVAVTDPAALSKSEYERIKEYIDQTLGMTTEHGATWINWQLLFAYGEKPGARIDEQAQSQEQ